MLRLMLWNTTNNSTQNTRIKLSNSHRVVSFMASRRRWRWKKNHQTRNIRCNFFNKSSKGKEKWLAQIIRSFKNDRVIYLMAVTAGQASKGFLFLRFRIHHMHMHVIITRGLVGWWILLRQLFKRSRRRRLEKRGEHFYYPAYSLMATCFFSSSSSRLFYFLRGGGPTQSLCATLFNPFLTLCVCVCVRMPCSAEDHIKTLKRWEEDKFLFWRRRPIDKSHGKL